MKFKRLASGMSSEGECSISEPELCLYYLKQVKLLGFPVIRRCTVLIGMC